MCPFGGSGVRSAVLEDGIGTVSSNLFYGCTGLSSVTIPNSVTSIGSYAFNGCISLGTVDLPYGLTSIGSYAFRNCYALATVTIPNATTSIGTEAFSYFSKLIIRGVSGSYAETYAANNNATFVSIDVPATQVALSEKALTLNKGTSTKLTISVAPTDFTDGVSWKSSDTSVATVTDAGVLKAVGQVLPR